MDFTLTADLGVKIKESGKSDKNIDFAIELKKNKLKRGAMVPIVVDAFKTILKRLVNGLVESSEKRIAKAG